MAILVRNDIMNKVRTIDKIEDKDIEILWIKILKGDKNSVDTIIGVYYGPQESENAEKTERQYNIITTQILTLSQEGDIILTGDFNAKVEIKQQNISQEQSRNGKYLENMVAHTNSTILSTKEVYAKWTRMNRSKPDEKSIIDYIITPTNNINQIENIVIDEEGLIPIKKNDTTTEGGERKIGTQTDHNTIITTIKTQVKPKNKTTKSWKKGDQEQWTKFNQLMQETDRANGIQNYEDLEKTITNHLNKAIGMKNSNKNGKNRETKERKRAKTNRNTARKEFENAIKTKHHDTGGKKKKYIEKQKELRKIIEREEREKLQKTLNSIINEGGVKSQSFWKARRRIMRANQIPDYDTIDEKGKTITDPEESKEHIATYYENLYQAREAKPGYEEITKTIKDQVKTWATLTDHNNEAPPITTQEMKKAIMKLKNNKSCGPDNIPNEVFTKADNRTILIYRKIFNKLMARQSTPEQWQIGIITRLYKGKGKKGQCSNERGITVASNVGKLYERIINNRATQITNISDAQAGGKIGRSTTDHLLILKEIINTQRTRKRPLYLAFLDVTKAYDKAWSDGIMYALHNSGLTGPIWNITRKLNQNLRAQIKTKDGLTRQIIIKDSIRQGGVLSVLEYANVMDEIAKEICKMNKGIKIPGTEKTIGCLLWMDDVLLMANSEEELQNMLNETDKIANKYHLVFGEEKSKVMIIGKKGKTQTNAIIGEMKLKTCENYKYLGEIINEKRSVKNHLDELKRKAEGALQTILTIAGDPTLKGIQMETIWKLVETCIMPITTYGGETWDLNKAETKMTNQIIDNIIKRILMVPVSTPRETLYIETGLTDQINTIKKKKIGMMCRLEKSRNGLLEAILESDNPKAWKKETTKVMETLGITDKTQFLLKNKRTQKLETNRVIDQAWGKHLEITKETKSKVKFLMERTIPRNTKRPKYMNKLNRHQVSTIFKARTRMIDVKNNFRGKYLDNKCRGCKNEDETQEHVLQECVGIHNNNNDNKVTNQDIFNEDTNELIRTAQKINITMTKLSQSGALNAQPGDLGTHST